MKKVGIAIIAVGLILTLVTGFKYFTREKVVDIGALKITASTPHRVDWSPYVGVGLMLVGGAIVIFGKK